MIKKILNRKSQLGRTMLEMLATLAIIGVLSVTGLLGYRYAIEMHKENETVDWVIKSIVGARTGFITDVYGERAEEDDQNVRVPIHDVISGVSFLPPEGDGIVYGFTTPTNAKISVEVVDRKMFEVFVDNMTWNVCRKLLNAPVEYVSARIKEQSTYVYPHTSKEEIESFCEIVDPDKRSPSQPGSEEDGITPGASFILCFGRDCPSDCPEGKIFCSKSRLCCDSCTPEGDCEGSGCDVDTPYECEDKCCSQPCIDGFCPCLEEEKLCHGKCIPKDEECKCPVGQQECNGICISVNAPCCDLDKLPCFGICIDIGRLCLESNVCGVKYLEEGEICCNGTVYTGENCPEDETTTTTVFEETSTSWGWGGDGDDDIIESTYETTTTKGDTCELTCVMPLVAVVGPIENPFPGIDRSCNDGVMEARVSVDYTFFKCCKIGSELRPIRQKRLDERGR